MLCFPSTPFFIFAAILRSTFTSGMVPGRAARHPSAWRRRRRPRSPPGPRRFELVLPQVGVPFIIRRATSNCLRTLPLPRGRGNVLLFSCARFSARVPRLALLKCEPVYPFFFHTPLFFHQRSSRPFDFFFPSSWSFRFI